MRERTAASPVRQASACCLAEGRDYAGAARVRPDDTDLKAFAPPDLRVKAYRPGLVAGALVTGALLPAVKLL